MVGVRQHLGVSRFPHIKSNISTEQGFARVNGGSVDDNNGVK